ncbi:hypothetical protein [Sphingobium yanoikuyae]|uniref:hypothetical protein n=1 Tax=Sphingobium yanoikuyae TaxID=13690 RepID=UPI00289A8AC7|nr:hypothetical protein [Sphingobium yanoikuyae]
MSTQDVLIERLKHVLDKLPITARKASMLATGKPDAIRFILSGRAMPSADRLEAIARVLMTTPSYLLGATDDPSPLADVYPDANNRRIGVFPPDDKLEHYSIRLIESVDGISIYQASEMSDPDIRKVDQAGELDLFNLPRVLVTSVLPLPAGLVNRKMLYGFYATVTSISPRFDIGELIVVDPSRPPAVGDYVVAYFDHIWEDVDDEPVKPALLARLTARSGGKIALKQLDPRDEREFAASAFKEIHRIIPIAEMLVA